MGAVKFLLKYLAAVPTSPPNAQIKHRDVHDPNEWMDIPYEHSGTPQNRHSNRKSDLGSNVLTTDEKTGARITVQKFWATRKSQTEGAICTKPVS